MGNPLDGLCNEISKIAIAPIDTTQPLDEEKMEWYRRRFDMFCEDGVPNAINVYLEKLMKDDVNEHTLARILYDATSRFGSNK